MIILDICILKAVYSNTIIDSLHTVYIPKMYR